VTSDAFRYRIVPLIVACPIFLQNLDTSVMATALPSIAAAFGVPVLDLNLAIASYVISLAIFLPASAWLAERFGSRRVFCAAVLVFSLGSALCGVAQSLPELVLFRLLQGAGGSMMVPVGRGILLRSVPAERMVAAMVWFTLPGVIGRMMGPFFGGAIVTIASWHWIFLVNVPFGIAGIVLALNYIEKDEARDAQRRNSIDLAGLALLGVALVGLLGGLEMFGKHILAQRTVTGMILTGAVSLWLYVLHCRRHANPILDFTILRFPVFRISVLGGLPLRTAVVGTLPFLLPLLFQLGLGMTPLMSGLVTMCLPLGGLSTRFAVSQAIERFGFRNMLIGAGVLAGALVLSYGLFRPGTPLPLICGLLFIGGLLTSMAMVTLNTIAYADMPRERAVHATAMWAMAQQLSIALGVVLGAAAVSFIGFLRHPGVVHLDAADFPLVFGAVALLMFWSSAAFRQLQPEHGAQLMQQR
jgi:EmrB/QacA subfamily drug resistance transporter